MHEDDDKAETDEAAAPKNSPSGPDAEPGATAAPPGRETSADTETGEPEAAPESTVEHGARTPAAGGLGLSTLVAALALVLALTAATATGFLWWQYRQFYVALSGADQAADASLERARASVRALEDRATALETAERAAEARSDALAARLDAVPPRFAELERRIEALQGVSFDARAEWLRAEALYYLELAHSELALADHWETAIIALELADGRLRELADPAFAPVRAAIAKSLTALRGVDLPDVAGLSYSLSELGARGREFPLRNEAPNEFMGRRGAAEPAAPGLGRLWQQIKAAFTSFISVERRQTPVERALTPLAAELARREFEVELEIARLALTSADAEGFKTSVDAARALLARDFDTSAAPVASAVTFLERLGEVDVAPARPDLSEPIDLLRRLPSGSAAPAAPLPQTQPGGGAP